MTARIIPQLSVRDVDAYVPFLTDAFGFEVTEYWRDPNDPEHVNVELGIDQAIVGVGRAEGDRVPPQEPRGPQIGLYVVVDDVDAVYERARAANATITFELSDQPWGHRMFGVTDPEGHDWGFASPLQKSADG